MLETLLKYHRDKLATCAQVIDNENRMFPEAAVARAQIDAAQHRTFIAALEQAQAEINGTHPLWAHVKKGTVYAEIGVAIAQCDEPIKDNARLTLYRGRDGMWFVRPPAEFQDGRFSEVIPDGA